MAPRIIRAKADRPAPPESGGHAPSKPVAPAAEVRHLCVAEDGEGQRLDNYLVKVLKGAPKTLVYRIIRSGEVRVNKSRAAADTRLAIGDDVRVPPLRLPEPDAQKQAAVPAREFTILLEDEHLIAIDKPAGVAVHGGSGVSFGVIEQLRRARPTARFLELVHRLDKETSGLLLIAKKRSALTALQDQFRGRETGKTYAALVTGIWPASLKLIDQALHKYLNAEGERRVRAVAADHEEGKRSISQVRVVRVYGNDPLGAQGAAPSRGRDPALGWPGGGIEAYTLLDVTIKTGRTHQIRVHLASAGHPIIGDDKYGDFGLNKQLARGEGLAGARFDRMFLHARRLAFDHPASGERIVLEAPLPAECAALLNRLAEPH